MDLKRDITKPQRKVLKQDRIMDLCDNIEEESSPNKEVLKQFKKNLEDVLTPDVTDTVLLRFLRAKNFNLKKCEENYRTMIATQTVFKFKELEETWGLPDLVEQYMYDSFMGMAKDGTPIRYIALGRGDLRGCVMSLDVYDIGRYCTMKIEKDLKLCKEESKRLGREINEITYILDFENFTIGQTFFSGVTELGFDLFRQFQDLYPEIWSSILVVNVPSYFQTLFNLFKPILRMTVLQKVYVATKDQTPSLLLKFIDADVLPAFLGGKRVDSSGDPMCSEFIKLGGIVPEKYYIRNRLSPLNPTDQGVEVFWLAPRSCLNIPVVVRQANSIIRVQFRTEGGSVYSVLLYRKFGSDPDDLDLPGRDEYLDPSKKKHNVKQVSPFIHLQAHISQIDNYCHAPWPGIYIFRLISTYNWMSQRKCISRIRIIKPDECSAERHIVGNGQTIR